MESSKQGEEEEEERANVAICTNTIYPDLKRGMLI